MSAPAVATFAELFEAVVAHHPARTAVVSDEERLTYADLARRCRRLARTLIRAGLGSEDVVAVVADRSRPDWLTGVLGVLLSGAAYVAIDPRHPAGRTAFLLDDAAPRLLLGTAPDGSGDLPTMTVAEAVGATTEDGVVAAAEYRRPPSADDLAYLVYTSGSTGTPKGVAVTHRGLAALVRTQQRVVGTGPGDQVLQWAAPTFDASFWDITLALLHGATLHLAGQEQLMPGDPLAETLRSRGITCATLPPVALGALDAGSGLLAGGTIVSTGDTCTQGLVDAWAPGRRLINGYGPTETTVGATLSGPLQAGRPADIGTAFDDGRVRVLDAGLEPVPDGTAGEFVVGGPGVARGYHRRPRLTAERFRPDPDGAAGERRYLTGDLGCRRPDGRFEFHGRRDRQVKVHGYRIEPAEIEAVLVRHPDVAAAAVAVRRLHDGDHGIVAWVRTSSGTTDVAAVRAYLADRLPHYMVPALILAVPEMPVTAHGKIDRRALVVPAGPAAPADAEPAGGLEDEVRSLFAEALGRPSVEPADDFFALGGDSIRFTRLIGRLGRQVGGRLPIRDAFLRPTPRDLARLATAARVPAAAGAAGG